MTSIKDRLDGKEWKSVEENLTHKGYSVIENVLTSSECEQFIAQYYDEHLYRKTIVMERYRFGSGEYKYFRYPLPQLVTGIREAVYAYIAPVANRWMKVLQIDKEFPPTHDAFKQICHSHNQDKPTILILKYGEAGFNTLHQDLYGEIWFPFQLVLFLNEPNEDYTGGEFVLTESVPRAQSKANVIQPKKGDMLLFTTNFRPVKGSKGYYRATMKHGVSPVHSGERQTLGIIFHDALS